MHEYGKKLDSSATRFAFQDPKMLRLNDRNDTFQ
jgi:hypothetical protein